MEEKQIPYIVHEAAAASNEPTGSWLLPALVLSIILLFACNAMWLYAWMQYDYSGEDISTVTVDGKEGIANYIGNTGDIINGESSGD